MHLEIQGGVSCCSQRAHLVLCSSSQHLLQHLRDIYAPPVVTCDTSSQRLPMPSSPAFSGLCCSWWGLPGCGDVVSSPQESSGWVWRRAALPGTRRLRGFGWGWAFPRVQMLYFVWSGLGECRFGYTLPSLPQWRPKINIAQIVCPSNKQSVKIAVLPLRLRLIKVGSDCRSRALLGVCSNEVFAALKRHWKNMKWHNLQKLYH